MIQIRQCPFCERSIPEVSVFCPYCGKRIKDIQNTTDISSNLETGWQKSLKKIKRQVSTFIGSLEKKVENSNSFSYVNKQRILNLLNQLQFQEQNDIKEDANELSDWVKKVEEAISGDKCIICLQKFEIIGEEKLSVALCPSCNYAGHPNHFRTWLETKNSCPMCKSELSKSNLLYGYLNVKDEQMIFTQS